MNFMDTIYRAFIEYRKETSDERDCAAQRRDVAKVDTDKDSVEVTRVVCRIEQDWIDEIESGLVFVEKAIAEERQFIRAEGEIVPIEKVKRVSRDSVEHLSRHSNLITKKSTGDDLIPEQLYTVERLNDYAVYENRFLYMLLTCLQEFIGMRYTRILDLTNTYHGTLTLDKTVSSRQKDIRFTLNLDELRRNDPIMQELNPNRAIIERIGMLLKTVEHYMTVPLMEEVSKAAKLKPPVTKTNVLKMDKNFKGALKLYDFIASYDRDGYTVETVTKKMLFSEPIADEFAELYALSSFLTYEYGMGIKELLKTHYDEEEDRRRAIAEKQHLDQLRKLRRRIKESGESPEDYMLLLEKQLRVFEGIHSKLAAALEEVDRLNDENTMLIGTVAEMSERIDVLREEAAELQQKYIDDMAELRMTHANELNELNARHRDEMETLVSEHEQAVAELNENHEKEKTELIADYQAQIDYVTQRFESEKEGLLEGFENEKAELNAAYARVVDELKSDYENRLKEKAEEIAHIEERSAQAADQHKKTVAELNVTLAKKDAAIAEIKEENRLLGDLKALSDGRLNALRHQYGLLTEADDFTNEDAFNEIEDQYNAFRRFFKTEWKKTKKKIRAELLRAHMRGNTADEISARADGDIADAADNAVENFESAADGNGEDINGEVSAVDEEV